MEAGIIGKVKRHRDGKVFGVVGWYADGCAYIDGEEIRTMHDWEYKIIRKVRER